MTATLPEAVTTARDLVTPALRTAVDRLAPRMSRVAGYHLGWLDEHGRPTGAGGGKALRPALALLSAQAAGSTPQRGVPAAVAVELVHNFSLLHDDIMDGDRERRHRPTAWTVFGTSSAILAGDSLLTLAEEILLEEGSQGAYWAARCLSAATQRLIAGQTADLEFEDRVDVSLDECVTMASDKTAALLACSCSIGAMLVNAPPRLAAGLAGFGAHLGLAFQLVDDLLGIWGAPEVTGKPVLSDLRTRKKSLPVVAALAAGAPASARLRELLHRPEPLTEEDLHEAAVAVEGAGGRTWVEEESARQLAAAEECLHQIDMPDHVRQEFLHIARYVTSRDR
ncbi:MAG: polyprenyl synthetase family protein [Streptosporangiales bacterium]|nr:polyprenyl synthetase family protein [Streptosporangiales bacterium]